MTNAEKYLKDGKATEELIGEMEISLSVPYYEVARFWNKQIKPTLTEDERVILRNVHTDKWGIIGKSNFNELYLKNYADTDQIFLKEIFEKNSFPSIKKRRRI